jgi:hypothetical protein
MNYTDIIKRYFCSTKDWISQHAPQPTPTPCFPTFAELCSKEETPTTTTNQGIYETLLGGRPDLLYQDAQSHPEKYEDSTLELLSELVQKQRPLSTEEKTQLDLAVLSYHSRPSPKPTVAQRLKPNSHSESMTPFQTRPPVEAPEMESSQQDSDVVAPFWWLRS